MLWFCFAWNRRSSYQKNSKENEVLMCKCDSHWVDLSFILLLLIFILSFEIMEIMMAQQKKRVVKLFRYIFLIWNMSQSITLKFENNILSFVFLFAIVSVHDDESRSYIFKFAWCLREFENETLLNRICSKCVSIFWFHYIAST